MARLLLIHLTLALAWAATAGLAASSSCPVSMTQLGPTKKRRGPVRKRAGGKVTITASVQTTQAVDNAIVALFLPADFKLHKAWSTLKGAASAPIVDGDVSVWRRRDTRVVDRPINLFLTMINH